MSATQLVSIVIPAYKTPWFEQALQSALAQDYPHCEIIVSDDCPLDDIENITRRYQETSPFPLRYIRNQPSLGEFLNYEQCIRESQGYFVKFLFDDDVMAANCVSELVRAFDIDPGVVIASSRRRRIDAIGELLNDIPATAAPVLKNSILNGEDLIRYQARTIINFIGEPSSVLMRRSDLVELVDSDDKLFGLNGEIMYFLGDLVMYLKILRKGNLAYLTEPLSSFRVSAQQISQKGRDNDERAVNSHKMLPQHLKSLGWFREDPTMDHRIRVADFTEPARVEVHNVARNLRNSFTAANFTAWLDARKILPSEQVQIDRHRAATGASATILLMIDACDASEEEIAATLASLPQQSVNALSFKPVVLTNGSTDYPVSTLKIADNSQWFATVNGAFAEFDYHWAMIIKAGTTLLNAGLSGLSLSLPEVSGVFAVYADEMMNVEGYPIGATFRPDFNLDLLLSSPATYAYHWLFHRDLLQAAGGLDETHQSATELDLIVKLVESQGMGAVGHLSEPLLLTIWRRITTEHEVQVVKQHLANRGYPTAEVMIDERENLRIIYQHEQSPLVSIIIPAGKALHQVQRAVNSVLNTTRYGNIEILIVADNQHSPERDNGLVTLAISGLGKIRVFHAGEAFHRGTLFNRGAIEAQGDYLVFLHPEVEMHDDTWLANLLNHGLRPEVGVVGGKQLTPEGEVFHAGYVLGINGLAAAVFRGLQDETALKSPRMHQDQNYSAVSSDFMLVSKESFFALDGFDGSLALHEDIDLCLRMRERGYFTVWTPHARVTRHTPLVKIISDEAQTTLNQQQEQDEAILYQRWMPLISHDPAYNSNLSRTSSGFEIAADSVRTWRPLFWRPAPVVLAANGDLFGCGYYRIIHPFEAMKQQGEIDGQLITSMMDIPSLLHTKPDTLVIQRRITPQFHEWMERVKRYSSIYKVFELDDYLPNLPIKNHHRSDFKSDTTRMLRKSLSYMDRFVVSTEPLAEALSNMHSDIVVSKNRLPEHWWGGLHGQRNVGKKPRIGWAGGSSHTGDLEMIYDVVKAFADEVEWVFMGMCPPKLRPYVHEYRPGVDINLYPSRMAELNLDLALAPVEDNLFNACKSNLRLLEYGACGYPVICSDVECYKGDLPVTRVRNRFKDWSDAIRMHLNDPDASEKMGLALQAEIRRNWMLSGDHVSAWAKSWLA